MVELHKRMELAKRIVAIGFAGKEGEKHLQLQIQTLQMTTNLNKLASKWIDSGRDTAMRNKNDKKMSLLHSYLKQAAQVSNCCEKNKAIQSSIERDADLPVHSPTQIHFIDFSDHFKIPQEIKDGLMYIVETEKQKFEEQLANLSDITMDKHQSEEESSWKAKLTDQTPLKDVKTAGALHLANLKGEELDKCLKNLQEAGGDG